MIFPEAFGDEIQASIVGTVTDDMPQKEVPSARRLARLERDIAFTNLSFAAQCLKVSEGPKVFFRENVDVGERLTMLTVPLGRVGVHLNTVFVGLNTERPDPSDDRVQRLRATAYKYDVDSKQICQYPEQTAVLARNADYWEYFPGFGPFIMTENDTVSVRCWEPDRLQLETKNYDKISSQAAAQRAAARHLAQLFYGFSLIDERNLSLSTPEL